MKVTAYFYDKYTAESVWIAIMLWPLYFIPFYLFYNNIILSAIASLILGSFTALIFADTLIEYLVFFLGFGILLFGSMAMMKPNKRSGILFIISVLLTVFCGLLLYLSRTKIYNREKIPITDGFIDFTDTSYWAWTITQIILYIFVLYYMFMNKLT